MLKTNLRNNNNDDDNNKYNNNKNKPQMSNQKLQQVADYQPEDCLKLWTQTFILLWAQQKLWKKWGSTLQQRLATVCDDVVFSHRFFICRWNIQRIWPATFRWTSWTCRRLPDMMMFIALALQMAHDLKDTPHDYWSKLRQLHTPFYGETMIRGRFFAFCRQFTETD